MHRIVVAAHVLADKPRRPTFILFNPTQTCDIENIHFTIEL